MAEFVFSFTVEDYVPPFLRNPQPAAMATGVDPATGISVDILDDVGVVASSILVFVDGSQVYDGASGTFAAPFSGTVLPTTVDGYGGYHLEMSRSSPFQGSSWVSVRIVAQDTSALALDETWQFHTATALAELLQGPYEITLDARFSGPMLLSSLLDASLYGMSGGAYVRQVEPLPNVGAPTGVRLWVEGFRGSGPFTLTVSPLVRDSSGDVLAPSGRAAQISPFQSSAYFSNTHGYVRSWHVSSLVMRDALRAYLTGIRGMDVFDVSGGLGQPIRWAQILDGYGLGAACVLGTGDYAFGDTDPPFLANRSPAPGQTGVPLGTNIMLSVADETTSVAVTAIAIYVNTRLAFSGVSGWSSGYGGRISVGPQIIDIQLYPPIGGIVVGTNTVSVVAADLVGNLLDTSYTFDVGAPPPVSGGFGTGGFGTSGFGE